jgi:hypothetical protein
MSSECGFANYFVEQNFSKYEYISERKDFKAVSIHKKNRFNRTMK